jgi:hypothetical protein
LKVVVPGETTTMLARVVVTTGEVAEKKRGYRKIIIMEHTHTKVSPVLLYAVHSMHSRHTQNTD